MEMDEKMVEYYYDEDEADTEEEYNSLTLDEIEDMVS